MSSTLKKYIFVFAVALLFISPGVIAQEIDLSDEFFSPPQLDDGWQVADVNFANLDRASMEKLTKEIMSGQFRRIHTVLVAYKEH